MSQSWFRRRGHHESGPHTLHDLLRMVRRGTIEPTDLVRTPRKYGRNNWFPASEINGLFGDPELWREAQRMAGPEPFDPDNRADWSANIQDNFEELLSERIESDATCDSYESFSDAMDGGNQGDALRGVFCTPMPTFPDHTRIDKHTQQPSPHVENSTRVSSSFTDDNEVDEAVESVPNHAFMPEIEYHTALRLIKKGTNDDQKSAFEILRTLAELGHTASQAYLGLAYWIGFVVPQNHPVAAQWLRKAAEAGDGWSMQRLGVMLLDGDGIERNETEAFRWFQLAANLGIDEAMNNVAMCLLRGRGTAKDGEKAIRCLKVAAELECEVAQYNLGRLYFLGEFVERDYEKALSLFKLASRWDEMKAPPSEWHIYFCYKDGLGTDRNLVEADEWLKKGASRECPKAMMELGRRYMCGDRVECDYAQGAGFLRKAAERGDVHGQYLLGIAYLNGHGVPQDEGEAVKWFYLAAKQRHNGTDEVILSPDEATAYLWDLIAPLISSHLRNSPQ